MSRVPAFLAGIAAGLILTGCDDGHGYYGGGGLGAVLVIDLILVLLGKF